MRCLLSEVVVVLLFEACVLGALGACHLNDGSKRIPPVEMRPQCEAALLADLKERGARAEGLSLRLEQVPSPTELVIKMTLANPTSTVSFWVNARASLSNADGCHSRVRTEEIQFIANDVNHRLVRYGCSDLRAGNKPTDFKVLGPGEKLEFVHTLDPDCYTLVPGETLSIGATYMSLDSWPGARDGAFLPTKPVWSGWQEVIVPPGWKDSK
jgi:hypothetical protein